MIWKVYINVADCTVSRAVRKDTENVMLVTTSSGEYYEEIEAGDEITASHLVLIKVLRERVLNLESMLERNNSSRDKEAKSLGKLYKAQATFMEYLRQGELSLVDTGRRILVDHYRTSGNFKNEICSGITFDALVEGIEKAKNDCYED